MSRDEWNALVDQARACNMLAIVAAHGARLSKYSTTHEFVGPCPICGGRDRFSVNPKQQMFNCRGCRKGGHGPIDLEMFFTGVDFTTAVKTLTKTVALDGKDPATKRVDPVREVQHQRERDAAKASQHHKAAYLWGLHLPVAGSPVERYLRGRGFAGQIPPTIGYLPAHGDNPHAMISAFALPNEAEPEMLGAPLGVATVHLTRLAPDGSDRLRDKQAKIIVGSPTGLPIAVSSIADGLSLAITEGIEDALAYASIGMGAWAAGSAPFLLSLASSVPDYVNTIIIEQHDDPDRQGEKAVSKFREQFKQSNQQIFVRRANKQDAADWMQHEGVDAFRRHLDHEIWRLTHAETYGDTAQVA
jgi:putative DNA primase/helicase